jgi:Flp pilus assembly protein TadG
MHILKRDEGQALVETALSMTLFFLIMLGAVEFGQFAYVAVEVGNAAKSGAQYAAQSGATAADLAGIQTAAQNEYSTPASLTLVSPTSSSGYACNCSGSTASVSCSNNSLSTPTCGAGSALEVTVSVQTQVTYTPGIHIPGFSGPYVIHGIAKQKVLQ